jgi:threonylcarbamoyladenosine tRNA methylthiotransferase MtaB
MRKQVPGHIARHRAAELRALGEVKQREFAHRFIGRKLDVVVEGNPRDGWRNGLSAHYLPVSFVADADLAGRMVPVHIEDRREGGLIGRISE